LDGKSGFFGDCALFFGVLPHEGVEGREEIFDVEADKFISIAADLFLKFDLVDMELFEVSNDWIVSAGIMDLL